MVKERLIMDIGLHKGEDTEFYLKKGFAVVAVEANPALYKRAMEQFSRYVNEGRLTLLNVAISASDTPVTFYLNHSRTEWGTISPGWAARNERLGSGSSAVTVQGMQFRHLLERFGVPYYLKIDIEGADMLCVEALRDQLHKPKYISIESDKTSWARLQSEFKLLSDLGYRRFKIVNQLKVEQQMLPTKALEGDYVHHEFQRGSSGAFGEEAPGEWMSEAQAMRAYRWIFLRYKAFGDNSPLRNFNWKRPLLWRLAWLRNWLPENVWFDTHASR